MHSQDNILNKNTIIESYFERFSNFKQINIKNYYFEAKINYSDLNTDDPFLESFISLFDKVNNFKNTKNNSDVVNSQYENIFTLIFFIFLFF